MNELKDYIIQNVSRKCIEVCGDNFKFNQYECEDGNNINGDGCSSTCTIEKGFKCS